MKQNIIDYSGAVKGNCFLIKSFMSAEECERLVNHAENIGFDRADDKYPLSYRTNKRCWEDDETLAQSLWHKLSETGVFKLEHTNASGINFRLRYCRCDDSEVFNIHRDGRYYKTECEYSKLTFLLYLSDVSDYEGGSTRFFQQYDQQTLLLDIKGNKGDVLIFDHTLWHEGGKIQSGTKHILRSDVLFLESEGITNNSDHLGYIWKIIHANKFLMTSGRDAKIKIWDEDKNLIQTIHEHSSSVLDLAASRNRLFSCSRDSSIVSFSRVDDRYELTEKAITAHGAVLSIDVFNESELVSSGSDGIIRLWNENLLLQHETKGHNGWCWEVSSIGQGLMCSIGSDGLFKKWRACNDGISLELEVTLSLSALRSMVIVNDDAWIGTEGGEIFHINIVSGCIYSKSNLHEGIVREVTYHDEFIYTCGEDGCVFRLDPKNDDRKLLTIHSDFATSITIVNSKIYSGGYDGKIRVQSLG
jgi:predicted 2-oxoglutarate/Fe(II)-dependent dioxygenase YbiX